MGLRRRGLQRALQNLQTIKVLPVALAPTVGIRLLSLDLGEGRRQLVNPAGPHRFAGLLVGPAVAHVLLGQAGDAA